MFGVGFPALLATGDEDEFVTLGSTATKARHAPSSSLPTGCTRTFHSLTGCWSLIVIGGCKLSPHLSSCDAKDTLFRIIRIQCFMVAADVLIPAAASCMIFKIESSTS